MNPGPSVNGRGWRLFKLRRRLQEFWALRDVSFHVGRGESVGIIGHNGAGKSTILKLLSGITAPSSGEITIDGSIAALIEIGSGFHPELTGRENIYLSGSILGMRRREIAGKIDDIIAFAEIGDYVDVPVKWYSSGMYVRLGFAISAHLDPDILLLDEVLAVGDAAFQSRCIQRITRLRSEGATIVFISHDLTAVQRLCDRVILMKRGQIVAEGRPSEVVERYLEMGAQGEQSTRPELLTSPQLTPTPVKIKGLRFSPAGDGDAPPKTGQPIRVQLAYTAFNPVQDVVFDVFYYSHHGRFLQCHQTTSQSGGRIDLQPSSGTVEFYCPEFGLQPGAYTVGAAIKLRKEQQNLDCWYSESPLSVEAGKWVRGSFYMPHEWRIHEDCRWQDGTRGEAVSGSAPVRVARGNADKNLTARR